MQYSLRLQAKTVVTGTSRYLHMCGPSCVLGCLGASDGNATLPPISHDGRSSTILLPLLQRHPVTHAAALDEHSLMCVRDT